MVEPAPLRRLATVPYDAFVFGHKEIQTTATVVSVQRLAGGTPNSARYRIVLDVQAVDEPTFQATIEPQLPDLQVPELGALVEVRYDAKHHRTDLLGPVPAGSAQPLQAQPVGIPAIVETSREVIDARQVPGLKEAILAALQSHGVAVPSEGMVTAQSPGVQQAVMAALQAHGILVPGIPPVVSAPGQLPAGPAVAASGPPVTGTAPATASTERLQHLTMLRDSGILTPEEFETLQVKLQGG